MLWIRPKTKWTIWLMLFFRKSTSISNIGFSLFRFYLECKLTKIFHRAKKKCSPEWDVLVQDIVLVTVKTLPPSNATMCDWSSSSYISRALVHRLICPKLGLYSLSGKTSYRQISWSLEATSLDVAMVVSLWNCCRGTCQISEQLEKFKPESRGFETSRDLAVRRLHA